ncbi:MAG: hypothetical protein P1U86_00660 [Verrucomicrobiales bacterium]|nr:hypothetical protein [Verrucomicrobiales bacterium]
MFQSEIVFKVEANLKIPMILNLFRIALDVWIFATFGAIVLFYVCPGFDDERSGNFALAGFVIFVVGLTTLRVFQRKRVTREAEDLDDE